MAQSKAFADASHALNDLSHALALLESENSKLRAARDVWQENDAKLRELVRELYEDQCDELDEWRYRDRMRELGIRVNDCE